MPDRCRFSGTRGDGTCGQQAVITVTVGCVHEHVSEDVPVCQYHVEEVAVGDAYCAACWLHDAHDCPFVVDRRTVRDLEAALPDVYKELAHA